MFRLGCLLMVLILVGVPVLASRFLPWWGTSLVILGEAVLLVVVAPKLIAWGIKRFAIGLFKTKSEVLKGAQVHVHSVALADEPADSEVVDGDSDESEESDEDESDEPENEDDESDEEISRYVQIDFTLTPMPGTSKMKHWEPDELMLVPFDLPNDMKEDDFLSASIVKMTMVDEAGNETREFDKITGPGRFRAVFGAPAQLTGRVKFRYYFEGMGDLRLP
jgi:hypothetical protein